MDLFNSTTHGELTLSEVIKYIKHFLEEDPEAQYSLVVGTDSQERTTSGNGLPRARLASKRGKAGKKMVQLISAIVVHRKGFGGKYFWQKSTSIEVHSLREKIYAETFASLDLTGIFVPLLKKSLNGASPHYYLEIHVDVGEHGATREMIKEVVGMIAGNGYVAKTKPHAYGASYVADKHT